MPTYVPLAPLPIQFQDSVTSENMSGGSLEFYLAGTDTPTNLFSDNIGTSIGTSITLNSGGFPESGGNVITLWRDKSIAIKIVLKNSGGEVISTSDNIPALQGGIESVAALPTLPDTSYPVGSVVYLTTDGKLYLNVANVWTVIIASDDASGIISAFQGGVEIVTSLPALPDTAYPVGTVVFLTTDGKLYRNVADAWTTAVATVDLSGAISSAQGGIEILGALPTLPDAAYPVGSLIFYTVDGKLYRNVADAWTTAVATVDLTGTIDLATQISGVLTAAFAEAGLINTNVTINADGSLTGAGGGQASLTSLPGQVQVGSIAANAVTATEIAALTITAAEIAANTITAAQIAALTITAAEIAANTITASQIAANTITANEIFAGTITSAEIAANTIVAGDIAAGTITATEIATGTITANEITAGTITAAELASTLTFTNTLVLSTNGRMYTAGKTDFSDTDAGLYLGYDASEADYVLNIGDATESIQWDGANLIVSGQLVYADSQVLSFTPTWGAGFSTDPTGDFDYLDLGTHAAIWAPADRLGTADANSMSFSGVPTAIRPAATRLVIISAYDGIDCNASASISTGGVITFNRGYATGVTPFRLIYPATQWITSGSKGLKSGTLMFYPL